MSYIKHNWKTDDVVSSVNLNEMEDGIFNSQEKITESAKLSADLLSEGTTNKLVSQAEKTTWNSIPVVSVPAESTSTTAAKFLKVGDTEYKLSTGEGKVWADMSLSISDVTTLAEGSQVSQNLTTEYNADNFKNDYVVCNVTQRQYYGATTAEPGQAFQKVFVNINGFDDVKAYLMNTIIEIIKRYGFDHNYYRTIPLYGGCQTGSTMLEGAGVLDGNNVIYLQDVSQQDWEYNYEDEKEASQYKRESLSNDIIGSAFVISIKGTGTTGATFLYCLQKSQTSYWDTTENMTRWANIEPGKIYPVTFDGEGEGEHGTLRWMVQATTQPGSEEMWAVEATDAYKQTLAETGITFESNKVCADGILDYNLGLKMPFIGNRVKELTNIFSFNTQFGEGYEYEMQYIGRPNSYEVRNYTYIKYNEQGQPVEHVERNGVYTWVADVDGINVNMIIPDNYDEEGVPHRNTCLFEIDTSNMLDTNTIYRHTLTVQSSNDLSIGEYEVNACICAINSEAGESSIEYLLHSDEAYQDVADWILPISGTIGKVIGHGKKGTVIKATGNSYRPGYNRILLSYNLNVNNVPKLWENLPKHPDGKYYVYAANKKLNAEGVEETLENPIRLAIEKVAGEEAYNIHIHDSGAIGYNAPYRIICTEGAVNKGVCYYDTDVSGYVKLSSDAELFLYAYDEPTIGLNSISIEGEDILVGWDNEVLYKMFSGDDNFGSMNVVSHTYQALRMVATWTENDGKQIRTLFVNYIDEAGEWNTVPVITDYNKYNYSCRDFRSEVMNVKTPMSLRK